MGSITQAVCNPASTTVPYLPDPREVIIHVKINNAAMLGPDGAVDQLMVNGGLTVNKGPGFRVSTQHERN